MYLIDNRCLYLVVDCSHSLVDSLLSFKSRDAKKTVDDDAADDAADDAEPTATAVDDDDDASDDGQDDGDATAMRQRSRQQDENDYDGEEDEIEEMGVTVESGEGASPGGGGEV